MSDTAPCDACSTEAELTKIVNAVLSEQLGAEQFQMLCAACAAKYHAMN